MPGERRYAGVVRIAAIGMIALLLSTEPADAQPTGRVTACAFDASSSPLPRVAFVAWNETNHIWTSGDDTGCVVFPELPAGTYTLVARLAGFVPGVQHDVRIGPDDSPRFQLTLKLGTICECLVVANLREMWVAAVAVVRARTVEIVPPFDRQALNVHITVLEVLKPGTEGIRVGDRLTVALEAVTRERGRSTIYTSGTEILVFFPATRDGTPLFRVGYDSPWVLYVEPSETVYLPFYFAPERPLRDLLNELRTLPGSR